MWNESTEVVLCIKKHYLRYENKVNENEVLSYCEGLRYMWNSKNKVYPILSKLQPTIILN